MSVPERHLLFWDRLSERFRVVHARVVFHVAHLLRILQRTVTHPHRVARVRSGGRRVSLDSTPLAACHLRAPSYCAQWRGDRHHFGSHSRTRKRSTSASDTGPHMAATYFLTALN